MSSFFYVYTVRAKHSDIFLSICGIRAIWLPSFIRALDWLILVLALNKQADLLCIHTHSQISVVISQMLWIHPKFDTELWIIPFYMEYFYTPSIWWIFFLKKYPLKHIPTWCSDLHHIFFWHCRPIYEAVSKKIFYQ